MSTSSSEADSTKPPSEKTITGVVFEYWGNDIDITKPCSLYEVEDSGFKYLREPYDLELYSTKKTKVLNETKFASFKDAAEAMGIKLKKLSHNPRLKKDKPMGLMDKLEEGLSALNKFAAKVMAKDFLHQEAKLAIDSLNDCLIGLNIFDDATLAPILGSALKDDPQYMKLYRQLHGVIGADEARRPLTVIRKLCTLYILELEYMLDHIEPHEATNQSKMIKNVQLSHMSYMGLVEAASITERFAKAYLFKSCCMLHDWLPSKGILAKTGIDLFKKDFQWFYRFIDEHTNLMAEQANLHCSPLKEPTIFKRIKSFFKGEAYDPVLFTDDNKPNTNFLDLVDQSPEVTTYSILGLPSLNLFRHAANVYLNWRHARMQRKEYEKRYMENHSIALQMKLREMDPNSEEYLKLQKVIKAYEEMIDDATADIDHYRNS